MQNMKKQRDQRRSAKKNIGFYISLAICIAAVAGAALTTYGSIEEYNRSADEVSSEQSQEAQVNDEVSGQTYDLSQAEESIAASSEPERTEKKKVIVKKKEASEYTAKSEQTAPVNAEKSDAAVPDKKALTAKPVEKGEVIKGFSPKDPIKSETMNDWRTHSGVDISAGEGTPVRSIMDGTVKKLYSDPLLGNVIEISHKGGYEARYCGLTDTSVVKAGSNVNAGDTIGYIGKIPSESKDKPHLHLEVTIDGGYIDPTLIYE